MKEKILYIFKEMDYPDGVLDDDEICADRIIELIDAEVEKRIKERMPSNDEIVNEIKADLRRTHNIMSSKTHILIRIALDKIRSRLTKPGAETSQKTEGGEE